MNSQIPKWRILAIAGILILCPFAALASHFYATKTGASTHLVMDIQSVQGTQFGQILELATPFSSINVTKVAGNDQFQDGEQAFVYFTRTKDKLSYPYAIAKSANTANCEPKTCAVLKGRVISLEDDIVVIHYPFQSVFTADKTSINAKTVKLGLALHQNGNASLRFATVLEPGTNQPKVLNPIPTLEGFMKSGAKIAPAR